MDIIIIIFLDALGWSQSFEDTAWMCNCRFAIPDSASFDELISVLSFELLDTRAEGELKSTKQSWGLMVLGKTEKSTVPVTQTRARLDLPQVCSCIK